MPLIQNQYCSYHDNFNSKTQIIHTSETKCECQLQLQRDNNNMMKSSWTQARMHEINI